MTYIVSPSGEKRAPIAPAESGTLPSSLTLSDSRAALAGAASVRARIPARVAIARCMTAPTPGALETCGSGERGHCPDLALQLGEQVGQHELEVGIGEPSLRGEGVSPPGRPAARGRPPWRRSRRAPCAAPPAPRRRRTGRCWPRPRRPACRAAGSPRAGARASPARSSARRGSSGCTPAWRTGPRRRSRPPRRASAGSPGATPGRSRRPRRTAGTALRSSHSSSSAPDGSSAAAARRSAALWESRRRLPEIPRTRITT